MKKITIHDTILRDGEQAPGNSMTSSHKLILDLMLKNAGVDCIEVGFPTPSSIDFEATKLISKKLTISSFATFCRATVNDIKIAIEAGGVSSKHVIQILVTGSDLHLKSKRQITREQGIIEIVESVNYAIHCGIQNVTVGIEDASRAVESYKVGDAILLQACCHNPTGFDFTKEEWEQLAIFCKEKKLFPIFDAAYLGLSEGIDKDRIGITIFIENFHEVLIANSFSKNLSLYDERVGALTIISKSQSDLDNLMSQVRKIIRSMYSIPPLHGALIVSEILNNSDLDFEWKHELSQMRDHLNEVKMAFKAEMEKYGIANKFYLDFNTQGMFIYSDLNLIQIEILKEEFGIYILKSGRISLAGISLSKLDFLCRSLYKVVKSEN
ncbi:aminotransferase class I/II-fold pyridoxal phosphate-dependent enzyme [Fluviispira multicolorata]|uniref:Aminotransferase class I/II-fold pyridoxal phosphate-dependent enzyme n=1 Tax=Fluviispira multicolorata TaxID=2654512 RepID=A0A833JFA2_9BACT|nr:aminotransferase class I/II-fold pyridoxal phosphate-dependent enzyme [Fluviispira multicolorata]KAB8033644.1 aminotransferase class I/II-fold pyridoxal phosphate-dependent enzyme [Fluviispira multicolorata]